jgi:tetratricopeptide (TPR) repeat protein
MNQALSLASQGLIFKPAKYLEAAAKQFDKVLDVDPGYSPAFEGLGLAYLTEARIYRESVTAAVSPHSVQEAIKEFLLALEADPNYLPARLNLGEAYIFNNQADAALEEFNSALELAQKTGDAKDMAKVQTGIAKSKMELGDLEAARQAAETALKDDPNSSDAHEAYGRALFLSGSYQQAAEETLKAIDLSSKNLEARILLGDVFYAESFWAAASSEYEQAIALIKESASKESSKQRGELYRKIGECYFAQGDSSSAVTFLDKGLADDPSNYQAERSLAKAYWALREYSAAQKALEIAITISPSPAEEADAHFEMGTILEAAGDQHEAFLSYTAALESDPTNSKAKEALERLRKE